MNVSSSSLSGAQALWSQLASRLAAATSSTTSTYASSDDSSSCTATADSANRPPPPPAQFDCAMSTAQFACQAAPMGPPPGEDPMATLDADEDGSISAEEFGLEEDAGEALQALFQAIDSDGSGDLSTEETEAFRQQMMAMENEGGMPPPPPQASSGTDASSFLQELAQRYASLVADTATEGSIDLAA